MKSTRLKFSLCAGLLFFSVTVSVLSQEKPISAFGSFTVLEYKKSVLRTHSEILILVQSRDILARDYDSNVTQISVLKKQKDLGFFDRVQLKKILKDSEDLSQQIVLIDRQIISKQESIRTLIDKMIPLMEYEIRQTLKSIEQEDQNSGDRPLYIQNLQAMINEKLEYQAFTAEPIRAQIKDIKYQRSDDPDLLLEKSDFLMDQYDKLQRYIAQIESKIEMLESENEIKKQARKFIDDVYTFDKDREMKLASRRTDDPSGGEGTSSVVNSRTSYDDVSVAVESAFRGTSQVSNPLLLNTTLEISSLKINSGDDFKDIIRKLKHEKSLAQTRAKNIQKTADDIRRLAEIKLRYSR